MKAIEEMKSSVLAYCEEVCPFEYNKRHLDIGLLERASLDSIFYWLHVDGLSTIAIHENSTDDHIFAAYRMLGLAERDAVAEMAEKVAILENEVEFLKTIRESQASMIGKLHPETLDLQARNTALVAALRSISMETSGIDDLWNRQELFDAIGHCAKVSKSALATNTEKGGVQG